jgi:uncharacterized protein YuzE
VAVRITYDENADAAYIYLVDRELEPGRETIHLDTHDTSICLDFKNDQLVGIEILDASVLLPLDLLARAERFPNPKDIRES